MTTTVASTRRLASLGLVLAAHLVSAASAHAAGRDLPDVIDLPPIARPTSVALHESPLASLILEALGVRLEQHGIHVSLGSVGSYSDGCLGVKVSSGSFEMRFGHTEFSIGPDGIELVVEIDRIEITAIDIKTKTVFSGCDWGGTFEVGGAASDVKLTMSLAPRLVLQECGVLPLGDFSARVSIGDLNLKPLNNELDKLLKNLVEEGINASLSLLFPDLFTDLLENIMITDLCQSKLLLYKAYMGFLGTGVSLIAFPEETVRQLQPLFPTVDLATVRFGYRWQPERNNTTDCNRIYFSDEGTVGRLKHGLDLDESEWSLLLHELHHTEQCARLGGRDDYARRWFRDLELAALMTNLADPIGYLKELHDNMPMEQEAEARSNEIVVITGTVRNAETGQPVTGVRVAAHVAGTPVRGFAIPVVSDATGEGGRSSARMGSFALPVEAGSYDLYVWPEGARIQRLAVEDVETVAGDTIVNVDIEVDANGVPRTRPAVEATFRRGDVNVSGDLNIADALFTLSWLFTNGPAPTCEDAADANDDGRVDISDPLSVLGFLFLGGVTLPAPAGTAGVDPTTDSLGCAASA